MSCEPEHHIHQEVLGLLLLVAGTLLLLALVSYDARDVPVGSWLSHCGARNRHTHNFIGLAGAYAGGFSLLVLGASSFLVAVSLLGLGLLKLINPGISLTRRFPWVLIFVLSGACLLSLQHSLLRDWPQFIRMGSPGGVFGHWMMGHFFLPMFNKIGSLILLVSLYFSSLVLLAGIHPVLLIRKGIAQIPIWLGCYRQWRIARADKRERLELERTRLEPQARKLEKPLARKDVEPVKIAPEEEPEDQQPEFDPDRPAPQVIDTNVRRPDAAKKEKATAHEPKDPVHFEDYQLPGLDLLDEPNPNDVAAADPEELLKTQELVIETLAQFGIAVTPGDITRGHAITRYEVYPAKGVRVDKIVSLERDIACAMCAERINILAPIPGKDTVGIEIANSRKQKVTFRELMESDDWLNTKAKIPLVLGKDVYGKAIIGDLAQMPHLLVAGTTGSGKSVCINSIIASILYRFTPDQLRFIMIDPKVVELQIYNTLPHLVIPVVTDPKKVLLALRWVIDEMEKRYKIFAKTGVRNITSFNARPKLKMQKPRKPRRGHPRAKRTKNPSSRSCRCAGTTKSRFPKARWVTSS